MDEVLPDEQAICVECGMCCDGTLFLYAHLNTGERGNLPPLIEEKSYSSDGRDYFRLPCDYFSGRCTIYSLKKADVCSAFRCMLLKNYETGGISVEDAIKTVHDARAILEEITGQFYRITGYRGKAFFKEMLREMGRMQEKTAGGTPDPDFELLLARCNILEALLIRHFLPEGEFEKYMVPDNS